MSMTNEEKEYLIAKALNFALNISHTHVSGALNK
jgi:hypothetical protein